MHTQTYCQVQTRLSKHEKYAREAHSHAPLPNTHIPTDTHTHFSEACSAYHDYLTHRIHKTTHIRHTPKLGHLAGLCIDWQICEVGLSVRLAGWVAFTSPFLNTNHYTLHSLLWVPVYRAGPATLPILPIALPSMPPTPSAASSPFQPLSFRFFLHPFLFLPLLHLKCSSSSSCSSFYFSPTVPSSSSCSLTTSSSPSSNNSSLSLILEAWILFFPPLGHPYLTPFFITRSFFYSPRPNIFRPSLSFSFSSASVTLVCVCIMIFLSFIFHSPCFILLSSFLPFVFISFISNYRTFYRILSPSHLFVSIFLYSTIFFIPSSLIVPIIPFIPSLLSPHTLLPCLPLISSSLPTFHPLHFPPVGNEDRYHPLKV